jgi:hypothetical protein
MLELAQISDAWVIGWGIFTFVGMIVFSLIQIWLVGKAKESGELKTKIDSLESDLKRSSDYRIDMQMKLLRAEIESPLTEIRTIVAEIQRQLQDGRKHFGNVDAKCHDLEVKVENKLAQLGEKFATRDDLSKVWDALREGRLANV